MNTPSEQLKDLLSRHPNRSIVNRIVYEQGARWLASEWSNIRGTVYDLGCGQRPLEPAILVRADRYVGVDWASTLHGRHMDVVGDLNLPLPIADGVADTIISISVLEHLRFPETMLREAFRILKPGGSLLLQTPFQWHIHESPYDYFRYTPFALRAMLGDAGFEHLHITPLGAVFTTIGMKLNYWLFAKLGRRTRFRRMLQKSAWPFYAFNSYALPSLDRLDGDPMANACGFGIVAKRSEVS